MSKKPEFKSVSVKEEFAESIEEFIYQHPSLGYRSIAQFLEDSARRRLEELKAQVKTIPHFYKMRTSIFTGMSVTLEQTPRTTPKSTL